MTWDVALAELFDELETEAHGQALTAREEDVDELARAEYAEVGLESRLLGSLGEMVTLDLVAGRLVGRLVRVGRGCAVVQREAAPTRPVLVNLHHLLIARTPSSRAVSEESRPLTSKLGLASALRHLTAGDDRVLARLVDGRSTDGTVTRVGADFVEVEGAAHGAPVLVPMSVLVTVEPT